MNNIHESAAERTAPVVTPPPSPESIREERLREIVDSFGPAFRRLVAVYEFDAGLREDLLQEILLCVWRALPGFRGDSSLRTWAFRVAHNTALKHQRGHGRARHQAETHARDTPRPEATLDDDPATISERREELLRLQRLVGELEPVDRQLVILQLEGFSRAEIAEITGLSSTNASTRLHRLRARLTRRIEDETREGTQ
ncbi:MAG: RNA polymerase sigma-70 factor (ECF subfamily) [Chlamydiales bacterium]|jgi:RNA polymerase sigma-70 factor (ECF subfamily)